MSAHTPGPWLANQGTIETDHPHRTWRVVAHACGEESGLESEQVANARLIAAAPDLLDALEQIEGRCARISEETLEVFQLRHELREVRLAAHSAIAVARGGK